MLILEDDISSTWRNLEHSQYLQIYYYIISIIIKRLRSLAPGGVQHEIQVSQIGEGAYGNEGNKEKGLFKSGRDNYHCSRK